MAGVNVLYIACDCSWVEDEVERKLLLGSYKQT